MSAHLNDLFLIWIKFWSGFLALLLTGAVGHAIGRVRSAMSYVERFEEAVAREAEHRGVDGIVAGHIHHADTGARSARAAGDPVVGFPARAAAVDLERAARELLGDSLDLRGYVGELVMHGESACRRRHRPNGQ